jgi:hypothetical protein
MHFIILQDIIHQNNIFCLFSNSTEIPEWFSHQSPGSSVTIPLPSDLLDNSSWEGIALFVVVVIHKNLNNISSGQDYKFCIDFICRSGMVEGLLDCSLVINIPKELPKLLSGSSSFGFKVINPAGILRDHLEEWGCIGASITSNHPYLEIKMCAARILYRQNLVEFLQAHGQNKKKVDKMETSKSNGQSDSNVGLKRKLKSLLLRLYQVLSLYSSLNTIFSVSLFVSLIEHYIFNAFYRETWHETINMIMSFLILRFQTGSAIEVFVLT